MFNSARYTSVLTKNAKKKNEKKKLCKQGKKLTFSVSSLMSGMTLEFRIVSNAESLKVVPMSSGDENT